MSQAKLPTIRLHETRSAFSKQLHSCRRCPRLSAHHDAVRRQYPDYHAAPVGSWGANRHRGLVIGLAPGLHGAARTGKAFVGDASGTMLFDSLHRCGLASSPDPTTSRLVNIRLTNVVKCLPPGNAPLTAERNLCSSHLQWEINHVLGQAPRKRRVLVCLGGFAHRAVYRTLNKPAPTFSHGLTQQTATNTWVISSFHPSRLNINTGRITAAMLDQVFSSVDRLLHE